MRTTGRVFLLMCIVTACLLLLHQVPTFSINDMESRPVNMLSDIFPEEEEVEAVPEPVINTTRALSSALANRFIKRSFSSINSENSGVLKYGTCSAPMALTASLDITGPTVKLSIYYILINLCNLNDAFFEHAFVLILLSFQDE